MYKALDPIDKANDRSVSVLPLLSKVFEKDYLWPALWIYGKPAEQVIVQFPKSTHALLIAKLEAYGLDTVGLNFY